MAASPRLARQPWVGRPRAEMIECFIVMHYVYIIQSKKNRKLYKGSTSDLKQRMNKHNSGGVSSTKAWLPWILVYYEGFTNKTDALREEKFLKSGKGKERIKYLLEYTLKK